MEYVNCYIQGAGRPLVLIHGFCEDMRIWETITPLLTPHYKLVLIDLPGFGKSPLAEEKEIETIDDMARRVAATLKKEGITTCTLIGHSMGGYVALAFAEKFPEMLEGFGLFHSTAFADDDERRANRLRQVDFIRKNGVEPFVETLVPTLFAKSIDYAHQRTIALDIARQCSGEGLVNALLAMRQRPDRVEVLKEARVPVLFVAGIEDTVVPAEKLSYQAALAERSQFELFAKSGHMGMLEEPERAARALQDFMDFIAGQTLAGSEV